MKPEVKEKLVAALRSGEYKKIEGRLYKQDRDGNDCYCALGVLCVLAMQDGVEGLTFEPFDDDGLFFKGPELDREDGKRVTLLPTVVMEWSELDSSAPNAIYRKNDNQGPSVQFPEMADWIEAEF